MFTWMSCIPWHLRVCCLLVISISLRGNGKFCPNQRVEVLANSKTFDETLSTGSCSHNCSSPGCLMSVSQPEGFNVTLSGCSSIRVQGNTPSPGDTEVLLKYQFVCNDFDPPPFRTGTGSLLIRAIELELTLDQYERNVTQPVLIRAGTTVRMSCFSHVNDSSDIPVTFHLTSGNKMYHVFCPLVNNSAELVQWSSFPERNWRVCRNTTKPHNCILVLYDFGESDDGTYTCSTDIAGRDDESNALTLQALGNIGPTSKPPNNGSIIGIALAMVCVVLLILIGLICVLSNVLSRRRGYQPVPAPPPPDPYITPPSSVEGSAVHDVQGNASVSQSSSSGASQPQFSIDMSSSDRESSMVQHSDSAEGEQPSVTITAAARPTTTTATEEAHQQPHQLTTSSNPEVATESGSSHSSLQGSNSPTSNNFGMSPGSFVTAEGSLGKTPPKNTT